MLLHRHKISQIISKFSLNHLELSNTHMISKISDKGSTYFYFLFIKCFNISYFLLQFFFS